MVFFLAIMLMLFGFILAGISGILPIMMVAQIPLFLRLMLFIVGMVIAIVGYIILYGRADKTGAKYLINPAKRGEHLWFYAYRDGSILITPGIREVESQLYSPELDAQIQEYKSYRIFDHSVRFVPEGIGHAIDLGMCLYVQLLRGKYGFERIEEARETASQLEKLNPIAGKKYEIIPKEHILTEEILRKADEIIRRGEALGSAE
jgi:hypothetical protein